MLYWWKGSPEEGHQTWYLITAKESSYSSANLPSSASAGGQEPHPVLVNISATTIRVKAEAELASRSTIASDQTETSNLFFIVTSRFWAYLTIVVYYQLRQLSTVKWEMSIL